ncbi:unnamed protein product [Prorocentrum cordatum]|uniref:Uncharacterized protein n=1 Tax=Prorocentrum cordatum TaxID=2364126 RepID=A0ABN9T7D6_9DINO|nr:unnamed protein product [Polarella glacialis]
MRVESVSAERQLRQARERLQAARAPAWPSEDGQPAAGRRARAGGAASGLGPAPPQPGTRGGPSAGEPGLRRGTAEQESDVGLFEADGAPARGEMAERAALLQQLSQSQVDGQATKTREKRLEALLVKGQRGWKSDRDRLLLLQQKSAAELAEGAQRLNASQARARRLERLLGQDHARGGGTSGPGYPEAAGGRAGPLARGRVAAAAGHGAQRRAGGGTAESGPGRRRVQGQRAAEEAKRLSAASSELLRGSLKGAARQHAVGAASRSGRRRRAEGARRSPTGAARQAGCDVGGRGVRGGANFQWRARARGAGCAGWPVGRARCWRAWKTASSSQRSRRMHASGPLGRRI